MMELLVEARLARQAKMGINYEEIYEIRAKSWEALEQAYRVLRFLLVCLTVRAQAEHLMVKGTCAEREAVNAKDASTSDKNCICIT